MPAPSKQPKVPAGAPGKTQRVKLKPHDSFDLIRLLARSQSDARKAVCELVQNSLDAGAERVDVTWFNEKGLRCLRIRDDGRGIFPELGRPEALQRLAQTIGHSHKRSLTAAQRHEQMVLGKYGIGLLGFWCVARTMQITSRVAGGDPWVLRLEEDAPEAQVYRARAPRIGEEETFTEVLLKDVKESVARQVRPPRLQAFLASELRGQLLMRTVKVLIHDRVARGLAIKEFVVEPRSYLGAPIEDIRSLEVPGREDARVELYHVPEDENRRGVVALACGGTTVLDDLAHVDLTDPEGALRAPWSSGRFEGVIDFPELQVAPGTRRGFVPDDAALDFLVALETLEGRLALYLSREAAQRAAQRREHLARDLRRAFSGVARRLPQYDLFAVRGAAGGDSAAGTGASTGSGGGASAVGEVLDVPESAPPPEPDDSLELVADPTAAEPALFEPGPLASLRVTPARLRIAAGAQRKLRAVGLDADLRPVNPQPSCEWLLVGPGELAAEGPRALYGAPPNEGRATLVVEATDGPSQMRVEVPIEILGEALGGAGIGIPEPQAVNAPSEPWRSRVAGERWEYNEGHRDFLAVREDDTRRFRYLCHLFAKEVVLRNFGDPHHEELLERMVELLTYLGDARGRGA